MRLNLPFSTKNDSDFPGDLLDDPEWLDALWARLQSRAVALDFDEHHTFALCPKPGRDEYAVLEMDRPGRFWAFLDLSDSRQGDEFIVCLYIKLGLPGRGFELHEKYTLQDQQAEPIVSLLDRFVPACRLTVSQSRGLGKEVFVETFVQYAGKGKHVEQGTHTEQGKHVEQGKRGER